jgi:high-affinity Fe2+/Pb2+ permease
MKKISLFSMLLILSATSFSQQTNPSPALTKQDYLKKSKNQKTIAWILVGGGVGLVVVAIATTTVNDVVNSIGGDASGLNTSATLYVIGGITALSSIPLFIIAGSNKRKAMSMSFKNEMVPQLQNGSFVNRSVPSLSLKISL